MAVANFKNLAVCLVFCSVFGTMTVAKSTCDQNYYRFRVGEENRVIQYTSQFEITSNYSWEAGFDNELLASCFNYTCEVNPNYTTGEVILTPSSREVTNFDTYYEYKMQISKVTTEMDASWHITNADYLMTYFSCRPYIYAPPTSASCSLTLDDTAYRAKVNCTSSFYPLDAYSGVISWHSKIAFTTYDHRVLEEQLKVRTAGRTNDELFEREYVLDQSMKEFGAGQHTVWIKVDKVESTPVRFELSYPTPEFTCQISNINNPDLVRNGYFRSGSGLKPKCLCKLKNVGYPPGFVALYRDDELVEGPGEDLMIENIDNEDLAGLYSCRGVSDGLGYDPSETKFDRIAYGPKEVEVSVSINTSIPYQLCSSGERNITVTCKVDGNTINPDVRVMLMVQSKGKRTELGVDISGTKQSEGGMYVYSEDFSPTTTGEYSVTCLVTNIIFEDISAEARIDFQVGEGDTSPSLDLGDPDMNKGRILEGEKLHISCQTCCEPDPAKAAKLTCFVIDDRQSSSGLEIEVLYVSKELHDGAYCICSAPLSTGCATKEYNYTLRVVTASEIAQEEQDDRNRDDDDEEVAGAIAGGVIGGVLVILLIVFLVWLTRKRKPKSKYSTGSTNA